MRVLVIIGNFYPNPSSVANCARPLLDELGEQYNVIDIISNVPARKVEKSKISENIDFYGIPDKYSYYVHKINRYFQKKYNTIIYRSIRRLVKVPLYLRYQLFSPEKKMGGWSISKSVKWYKELAKTNDYDLVLSISQPFTAHIIAGKIKAESNIPWIAYQYDPYSYNSSFSQTSKFYKAKLKKQENSVFSTADKIILTRELYEYYLKTELVVFKEKFVYLDYILFENKSFEAGPSKGRIGLSFAYAGGFYTSIRNPMHMLEVMKKLPCDFTFFLLTGYSELQFNAFISQNCGSTKSFKVLPKSNHDVAIEVMNKADLLISVGNTTSIQVPGKIFEYMGIGKPIIHFSKIHDDPAVKYLKQYPLSLIIKEDEGTLQHQVDKITYFIKNVDLKKMEYQEVVELLSEHNFSNIYGQFISIIDSVLPKGFRKSV